MQVNANSALGQIQQLMERNYGPESSGIGPFSPGSGGPGTERISPMGSLLGNMPALNADQQSEMRAFRDEMRTALTSGTFNADEMAGKAPEYLQQHAADKGVSLADAFQQVDDRLQSLRSIGPMLNVAAPGLADTGQGDLLQSLLSSLEKDA